MIAAVLRVEGEAIPCGAPGSDPDGTYRLALSGDDVTLERQRADGVFEAASLDG